MKFRSFRHTADCRFRIYGRNYQEIINNSLNALNQFLQPILDNRDKQFLKKIKLKSFDTSVLLIDFLNEILSYVYLKKIIFVKFNGDLVKKNDYFILQGYLKGFRFLKIAKEIKSITYHRSFLFKSNKCYIFDFIIDI